LADSVIAAMPPNDGMRVGIVETVNPLLVNITGGLVPAGIQGSYLPAVGDNVTLLRQDSTWLITGRVGSPQMAYPTEGGIYVNPSTSESVSDGTVTHLQNASMHWSKTGALSLVRVDLDMTMYVSASGTEVEVGFQTIAGDGSNPFGSVALFTHFFNTISSHLSVGVHRPMANVPPGDWLVRFWWRRIAGAGTASRDGNDRFSVMLKEM
jgi:hypothetical protein